MKKGFTLAELMIVLVVLGIITAILTPSLLHSVGDTNRQLYKSAFNMVQQSVSELLANNTLYPDGVLTNGATTGSTAASDYFCTNLTNLVNTLKLNSCSTEPPTVNSATFDFKNVTPDMITSNGMYWWGLKTNFSTATGSDSACTPNPPADITVNGVTYHPATLYVGVQGASGALTLYKDIFRIFVYGNGKVTAPDDTNCAKANTSSNEMIYLTTMH